MEHEHKNHFRLSLRFWSEHLARPGELEPHVAEFTINAATHEEASQIFASHIARVIGQPK